MHDQNSIDAVESSECAMIYIKKGIQKEKKNARSKLN